MQPTLAECYEAMRSFLSDRVNADGQLWPNSRCRPFMAKAITKLMSEIRRRQVDLGIVDAYVTVPPNQGYLDLRAYGINNMGSLLRVEVRSVDAVSGGPFTMSAAEVYGAEPYGAPQGGINDNIPGTGILAPGSDTPPYGAQVIVQGSGAHGLDDAALVTISPKIMPAFGLGATSPVLEFSGEWSVAAYSANNFALVGCRSEWQFNQLPVDVYKSDKGFTEVEVKKALPTLTGARPTTTAQTITEIAWRNESLRWYPVASAQQLRLEYQASGSVPQLLSMRIAVDESLYILAELAAGYALLTTPDKETGMICVQSVLGPNMGEPVTRGTMKDLLRVVERERQDKEVIQPTPYRYPTHHLDSGW